MTVPRRRPPLVVVFCRAPVPARAKTRLCPPLAPVQAAALSLALLLDVLDGVAHPGLEREAAVARPRDVAVVRALVPPEVGVRPQADGDLGARMGQVVTARCAAGHPAVVFVGADCPTLTAAHVRRALTALADGADAALSPSGDGGYSLLALARPVPELLAGIPWGSDGVMGATRDSARAAGLRLAETDRVDDVDRPDDVERLAAALAAAGTPSPAPRTWHMLRRLGFG